MSSHHGRGVVSECGVMRNWKSPVWRKFYIELRLREAREDFVLETKKQQSNCYGILHLINDIRQTVLLWSSELISDRICVRIGNYFSSVDLVSSSSS